MKPETLESMKVSLETMAEALDRVAIADPHYTASASLLASQVRSFRNKLASEPVGVRDLTFTDVSDIVWKRGCESMRVAAQLHR